MIPVLAIWYYPSFLILERDSITEVSCDFSLKKEEHTERYKKARKLKACITLNLRLYDTNYISCGKGIHKFLALINWHFYRLPVL